MSTFEIPYEFSLHESPVSFTDYLGECPPLLLEDLYATGSKSRKPLSENWPITGGTLGDSIDNNSIDLIITGHADGTVKFWDGSSGMFTLAGKLSTHKYFHKKRKASRTDSSGSKESTSEEFFDEDFDFLAIHMVHLCVHSRTLALVNAANHVLYFTFDNNEQNLELAMISVEITTEKSPEQDVGNSPESNDDTSEHDDNGRGSPESNGDTREHDEDNKATDDKLPPLSPTSSTVQSIWRPKLGLNKRPPGFQAQLCCRCEITGNAVPLCYLTMSSAFGIMAFGSINFLVLIDTTQNKLISTFYPSDLTVSKIPSTPSTPITPRTPGGVPLEAESPGGRKRDFKPSTNRRRATRTKSKPLEIVGENDVTSTDGGVLSQSSTDGVTENILCITCAYTFTKKGEHLVGPCLWVGTSLGNVVLFAASFPPAGEQRQTQPVLTFNTGLVFTHKGEVDSISVLDKNGHLLTSPSYFWTSAGIPDGSCTAVSSNAKSEERHFLVVCTDKEAEVHCLPSHQRFSKKDLSENKAVLRSDVISIE
ncbi:syntaxin-binding 5 isoform X4, partial [Paramuricea clavata]